MGGIFNGSGYGQFWINEKGMNVQAHRVVYELAIGPISEGMCVLHRCDNKICVNPSHLFLGSQADNIRDKTLKDRQVKGENHPHAKLRVLEVEQIRQLYRQGEHQLELARQFQISQASVSDIIRGRTWRAE